MDIIINADDFGCNSNITNETIRLLNDGYISSATIMANGEDLDAAAKYAIAHPEFSFGAHLCLSEFKSITNDSMLKKYGICDNSGNFIFYQIFKIKQFPDELKDAIERELSAQVDLLLSKGINISHIDSHHHVHTIYALRSIFLSVAKKYNIMAIRRAMEFNTIRAKLHVFQYSKRLLLNKYYCAHLKSTNVFMPVSEFILNHNKLEKTNVLELMCHPGSKHSKYQEEIINLIDYQYIIANGGGKLITYKDL